MRKTEISATLLTNLSGGDRCIMRTKDAGTIPNGVARDGSELLTDYPVGALILSNPRGDVIVGPIDIDRAVDLAHAMAIGNARALTEPQASLIIATTLLAVVAMLLDPANAAAQMDRSAA